MRFVDIIEGLTEGREYARRTDDELATIRRIKMKHGFVSFVRFTDNGTHLGSCRLVRIDDLIAEDWTEVDVKYDIPFDEALILMKTGRIMENTAEILYQYYDGEIHYFDAEEGRNVWELTEGKPLSEFMWRVFE